MIIKSPPIPFVALMKEIYLEETLRIYVPPFFPSQHHQASQHRRCHATSRCIAVFPRTRLHPSYIQSKPLG